MTFNGLESCVLNNQAYENESRSSRADECTTDSLEDHDSSCSSSKDACGSSSSKWLAMHRDEQDLDEWELPESPQHFYMKEKPDYTVQVSDVEAMKEKFTKLLLGEDVTGGQKGLSSALSLSNAITNLAGEQYITFLIHFNVPFCFNISILYHSFPSFNLEIMVKVLQPPFLENYGN